MTFFKQMGLGFRAYGQANDFIFKHRLWGFVLLPGLINLLLLTAIVILAWYTGGRFSDWLTDLLGMGQSDNGFIEFFKSIVRFFVTLLIKAAIIGFYLMIYKYVVLIIMSPVLARLSERTEEILTGKKYPFSLKQLLKDAGRGALVALQNLLWELLAMLVLFLFGFIPVVGLAAPVLMFFVESYFYGYSMMDYTCERRRMNAGDSGRFIYKYKGAAVANGMVFLGLLALPIIGLLAAPAYGVVAATLSMHEIETKK